MGTYRLLHELYDNMITFQFSRSLLHMFKCSSCVSILCVMVFGVPVVSENVGNEAQSHQILMLFPGVKTITFLAILGLLPWV